MSTRIAVAALVLAAITASTAPAQVAGPPMPMDRYVFGLLRRGPAWTARRTPQIDSIQAGHMANIHRMAEEGALLAAGPFLDGGDLRGVFIFRDDSLPRLRALAARDPAIRARRLVLDLWTWYAPAGIGRAYFERWKQPGFRDSMVTLQMVLLRRGPRWTDRRSPALDSLQARHVASVFQRLQSGEAAVAGPLDSDQVPGLFVFRGDSATAAALAAADPAVRAGRLRPEQHPWMAAYGTMPGDTLRP